MKYNIFKILCERLGSYLIKEDTHFRGIVLMQERVAMSLHWLDSGDELQSINNLYGVHKNTLLK